MFTHDPIALADTVASDTFLARYDALLMACEGVVRADGPDSEGRAIERLRAVLQLHPIRPKDLPR